MSRKGENIYKRKDGRWEGRYMKGRKESGKAIYGYVYAKTYNDAKNKLREKQQKISYHISKDNASKQREKFSAVAGSWLEQKRPQFKESTYIKYVNLLKYYILPNLGEVPLSKLTADIIEDFCKLMLQKGGRKKEGLSSKTVSDILSLMRSILCYASNNGYSVSFDIKSIVIKQEQKEMQILTKTEQRVLCQYIIEHPTPKNLGILICMFTGIRVGEVCALQCEDISISEKTIHVHQTMQRIQTYSNTGGRTKIIVTVPKSRCSVRTIPLPDELVQLIQISYFPFSGYFLTGSQTKWIEPRTMQNHFKSISKKCSIREINFHALRHTFATRCVEYGFDVKSLSEILGHASVNITMNRYVHPTMELKRNNMERLSPLLAVR
ncbi:hypothetical protein C818_01943 [Lachnospiraceae bacterium MD308]|nr:hypothetical protein C818_01943 [Lachnospiraceae bacterium MD308]